MLGSGREALADYQRALDEWRLLTASALVGLVEETMTIAAEFAKTRYTLGVPISTLQGISHPLANIAITVQGGRNLARRAAWFLDNEPDERPELAPSAFVFMAEEAAKAATMAVHVQGGLGVSAEAAATAYLVRARGWPLAGGDPGRQRQADRRDRRRARKPSREQRQWISHVSNCPTTIRPSWTRCAPSCATHVTDDVLRRDRETGDNFDEGVHLAIGAAGYLDGSGKPEAEGGFSRVRRRIWELEKRRAHVPWVTWGTTAMVARSVAQVRLARTARRGDAAASSAGRSGCAWATPNPKAAPTSRRARPARCATAISWVINGSKMFTTGAHNCQYVFLITNTDPDAPKHKSLTMFLVPLDTPGIEIQGIRTVDGDRTNIVYYSDVRVDDKYRLGEVNGGWTVLREPLNAEHGAVDGGAGRPAGRLDHDAPGRLHGRRACDKAAARSSARRIPNGRRLIDDGSVAYRLGRSVARMEAALSTPNIFGRVALAQTMRDISPDLMDILGRRRRCRSAPTARPTTARPSTCTASRRWWASTAARSRCSAT